MPTNVQPAYFEDLKQEMNAEFGFNDDNPVWDSYSETKTAGERAKAQQGFAGDTIKTIREQVTGTSHEINGWTDSQLLTALAEREEKAGRMWLNSYRELRESEGLERGEFVDGSSGEMDDTYLDAMGYLTDAVVFKNQADMMA